MLFVAYASSLKAMHTYAHTRGRVLRRCQLLTFTIHTFDDDEVLRTGESKHHMQSSLYTDCENEGGASDVPAVSTCGQVPSSSLARRFIVVDMYDEIENIGRVT